MKIVDTRGQACPAPLIATKRALKESGEGEKLQILTDSQTSFRNISRFLKDNRTEFSAEVAEGIQTITVTKGASANYLPDAESYCKNEIPHLLQGDFIIAFSSDKMGEGNAELGSLLIVNFIKAIRDLDLLPNKIVFYNKGVLLATEDSPVFNDFKELEKLGVELLICSTCLKFFSIEEKATIGTISNIFEITQAMSSTGILIRP